MEILMLNHFTSKAYLVYATIMGNYRVTIRTIAIFNTEKRAIAFKDKCVKKYTWAKIEVMEVDVCPEKVTEGSEMCSFGE